MKPTRIAIVEDNSQYLKVLKSIIDSDSRRKCLYTYIDAERFIDEHDDTDVEVVFVDIQLPSMSGIELTHHIRTHFPDTKIIICSSYDDDDKLFSSLKNGAHGYILKSSTPDQILQAIEDVLSGGAPMSQSIAKKLLSHFYTTANRTNSLALLTEKENEVLNLLSQGLLYKEISCEQNITLDTVKKHCGNIYRKLQVSNRTEALNLFFNN